MGNSSSVCSQDSDCDYKNNKNMNLKGICSNSSCIGMTLCKIDDDCAYFNAVCHDVGAGISVCMDPPPCTKDLDCTAPKHVLVVHARIQPQNYPLVHVKQIQTVRLLKHVLAVHVQPLLIQVLICGG